MSGLTDALRAAYDVAVAEGRADVAESLAVLVDAAEDE